MVNGAGWWAWAQQAGYYVGNIFAVPRLGLPSIRMQDSTQGFRTTDARMIGQVTEWPCALAIAASWDASATWHWAQAVGREHLAKGANVVLGPSVNVHRIARNGRNAEYLSGEDPFLGSILTSAYVRGVQEGAGAASVVKHFTLNHQETFRESVDAHADERTRWEVYYPPFEAAVQSGVASVMCSYNFVNGVQACADGDSLSTELKGRMGFDGWVMSDWWALKSYESTAASHYGTDQDMPGTDGFFSRLVLDEELPSSRADDMVARILAGMTRASAYLNSTDGAKTCRVGCDCDDLLYSTTATSPEHVALARRLATDGIVLLKNDGRILPLSTDLKVAVLGSACSAKGNLRRLINYWTETDYYAVGGSGRVLSPDVVTIAAGLRATELSLHFSESDHIKDVRRAMLRADVALVCGGATTAESIDRTNLKLDQHDFLLKVTALGRELSVPTVVVALAPGAIVAPWSRNATAVVLAFPSGQETGNAVADVILGRVSPSGRLPVTLPEREHDAIQPCTGSGPCNYTEGLWGGRHIYDNRTVEFPFGHGLSYGKFEYTIVHDWAPSADPAYLWQVTISVWNTGPFAAADVPQLYVTFPIEAGDRPALLLRGFAKTDVLVPDKAALVTFKLTARDLSVWDLDSHRWKQARGEFKTAIGASSRDLRLCGRLGAQQVPSVLCHDGA